MKKFNILCFVISLAMIKPILAQNSVILKLDTRHKLGEVDSFDRSKFINFHATPTENYWDNGNLIDNLRDEILVKYGVWIGRDTGGLKSCLMGAQEDKKRPGFVDPLYLKEQGEKKRKAYEARSDVHKYEQFTNMILCNQFHPFYPDGSKNRNGFALSQENTQKQPFGTASGEFYGRYVKESFQGEYSNGEPAPKWMEIINEPLWDIYDMRNAPKTSMRMLWEFHKNVAREVKKYVPNIPVGGYVTAFPDFEVQDFERWRIRWREFMDIAGEDMDFWSIHLYDFPVFGPKGTIKELRKGSNMEATMDMIEQYSQMKFGRVKPLMISEYGAQTHFYNQKPWSAYRDWLKIASVNSMMMQFMKRANNINIAMPFFMLRSDWGYNAKTGIAHTSRVMRKANEPESFTGEYVFGEAIKIFQLWKDVKGTRVVTTSSNLDLLCDAYVDKNKAYLILNNLDYESLEVDFSVLGIKKGAKNIELRHLYLEGGVGGQPRLDISKVKTLDKFTLGAEASAVIIYDYAKEIVIDKTVEETKYYASTYLKPIWAKQTLEFEIKDLELTEEGEAVLRLGLGRAHGASLTPELKINGQNVTIPTNVRGDDQKHRETFFGVLEIPVDYSLLKKINNVSLTFPDSGGHVSTITMQIYNH